MRRAGRTDNNHAEIRDGLRQALCQVRDTSSVGGGFPDLVVRVPYAKPRPRIVLIEVKSPGGRLEPAQKLFIEMFPETVVVESLEQALAAIFEH